MSEIWRMNMNGIERIKDITIQVNTCSGWKWPEKCPNNGKFNPKSLACRECKEDALTALKE